VPHTKDDITESGHSAGDAAPSLFAPDLLLACQHVTAGIPDSPCRRLVGAVLERALLDVLGASAREAERMDALAWFRCDDDAPFTFRWIAHQLGIDPDWLQSRIEARQPHAGASGAPSSDPPAAGAHHRRAA
jgi:hypothetical protein